MDELLTPEGLCELICNKMSGAPEPLLVYWLEVKGNRDEYASRFHKISPKNLVSIVVRGRVFESSDSIYTDLVDLIERNRSSFAELTFLDPKQIALVLLSRRRLISNTSSPVEIPEWFPGLGGRIIECSIENLTLTAEWSLNNRELEDNLGEIKTNMLSFEAALLKRLKVCHEGNHNSGNALFELFKDTKEPLKYGVFLAGAIDRNKNIGDPSGYRPSARDKISLIGRVMSVVTATSPDGLLRVARNLAEALGLSSLSSLKSSSPNELDLSITTVLLRSTNPELDNAIIAAKNMLTTIYAACQLITASHHPQDYPNFPVIVLRATSFDISRSLRRMTALLDDDI